MGMLREMAEGQARLVHPGEGVFWRCGCAARPHVLLPCGRHRGEVMRGLLAVCEEDAGECQESCCDPA